MQDIKINDKIMPNDLKRSICNHFILWCSCIAILIFSSIISTDYFNQEFLNQKIISKISNIVITKVNSINPFYSRKLGISGTINTNSKDISNILISNLLIINKNTNSNLNNIIDSNNIPVFEWFICIPKIDLKAEIVDGTTQDILNKYVGHFEETPKLNGNVALAAHNRGYDVNYFALIKDLQVNDEIYYYLVLIASDINYLFFYFHNKMIQVIFLVFV